MTWKVGSERLQGWNRAVPCAVLLGGAVVGDEAVVVVVEEDVESGAPPVCCVPVRDRREPVRDTRHDETELKALRGGREERDAVCLASLTESVVPAPRHLSLGCCQHRYMFF